MSCFDCGYDRDAHQHFPVHGRTRSHCACGRCDCYRAARVRRAARAIRARLTGLTGATR